MSVSTCGAWDEVDMMCIYVYICTEYWGLRVDE